MALVNPSKCDTDLLGTSSINCIYYLTLCSHLGAHAHVKEEGNRDKLDRVLGLGRVCHFHIYHLFGGIFLSNLEFVVTHY